MRARYGMIFSILFITYLVFGAWSLTKVSGQDETVPKDSARVAPQDSTETGELPADSISLDSLQLAAPRKLDRFIPNTAFGIGERLLFQVKYGFIKAGYAKMEVKRTVTMHDSFPAFHIISTARSTRGFDLVFKVRDSVETFLDARGIFSWRYNKFLREGGYKLDLLVDYDQVFGKAHVKMIRYEDQEPLTVRKQEEFELPIPKYVLDVLAAFYYVRTQKLEVGMPIYMKNHDNKKIYNLKVIVQKKETISVPAGTFRCIVVQPRLKGEAIFKQKGKLWVWLTDDERKIPVQMKSKAFIGSIKTELVSIEGLSSRIQAKIK